MSGGSLGKISTFVPFIYTCFADAGPCALLVSGFENVFQKKKLIKIIHKKKDKKSHLRKKRKAIAMATEPPFRI